MSLLTVANLAKSFAADVLFSDITFSIAAGQKIGLIGRNGGGKTTLLRILLGQEKPEPSIQPGGASLPPRVDLASGRRMGYLRQEAPVHPERTIGEEIEIALAPVREAQAQVEAAEHALAAADDDSGLEAALAAYTEAHDRFESLGGFAAESERDMVLRTLGFGPETLDKTVGSCSGGEQTRLALARLVLTRPDLLILDEPTNHLDIDATEWLEGYLKNYPGAVLVVSHDRQFLDAVTDTTAELEFGKLTLWKGNYSHFRRQKDELLERQAELYKNQQNEIARLNDLIKRNMGANATQSAIRNKTLGRIDRMDKIDAPKLDRRRVRASIDAAGAGRIGREVVRLSDLAMSYGDRTLFSGLDAVIGRDDRVGLVGPNGAGKSTLVRLLLGDEAPTAGSIHYGNNVRRAYYSQHASDSLDLTRTVLQTLTDRATKFTETQARNYLARFLFTGDDVHKTVKILSGGEKSKLALACLLLEPVNFLILDEPTNHLDIASVEALTGMLQEYDGTLLLVSHDRYLLNEVTEKTLGITGTGRAELVEGNFAAWRQRFAAVAPVKAAANGSGPNPRELSRARAKAQEAAEKAERAVQDAEARLAAVTAALESGDGDLVALAEQHTALTAEVEAALAAWEAAGAEAESLAG